MVLPSVMIGLDHLTNLAFVWGEVKLGRTLDVVRNTPPMLALGNKHLNYSAGLRGSTHLQCCWLCEYKSVLPDGLD